MIKVLRTYEIEDNLWLQICEGFNECFNRQVTIQNLKSGYYVSNNWGYAYHAIALNDENGELMGFNTYSPTFYKNGIKVMVGGSVFVRPKFRKDIFIFLDMSNALRAVAKDEGFDVEIGLPNRNAIEYSLKFLKTSYIGELNYYILPIKISRCLNKSILRPLDLFSKPFSFLILFISLLFNMLCKSTEKEVKYSLITDDQFYKNRFKNKQYHKIHNKRFLVYYRVVKEEGANVVYLMDFREGNTRSNKSLLWAVWRIIRAENPDAIVFVGLLRIIQLTLFKTPSKFIPKHLPMVYYVINKTKKEFFADMSNINNWNFSLMNFDVR